MRAELVLAGVPVSCVVLELCSYGDSGDFQVLPMSSIKVPLEQIQKNLLSCGMRSVLTDGAMLAEVENVQLILHSDGRAVIEHVVPCSKQAAWDMYMKVMQMRIDK